MKYLIALVILGSCAFAGYVWYRRSRTAKRAALIDAYEFPANISQKVLAKYPDLNPHQIDRVIRGLREYFHICNIGGRRMISMPSQVVDVAWHEFILFTKLYKIFCRRSLGRFIHHTPAEAMDGATIAQDGIKRAWRISCAREKIDPKTPARLPLLFALDADLGIADGFKYSLNCRSPGHDGYCAGHIGCGGGCGGDSGADSCSSGCSSGCGGGCGGD